MKTALYIRVSTQEQVNEGYSVGEQEARLTAYCKAKGWNVHKIYTDGGFTGSNTDRPALKQMLIDIKNKQIDVVLVYKLDRLSRSQKDTLLLIEDEFLKNNVEFVSMSENFDTSTPFGRAMIGILSVFAQLEREQITERMAMGRDARAKEGLWHGGGFDPIGYDYVDGQLVVNDYEAMQIRLVHKLFLDGTPINRIQTYMQNRYTTKHGSWSSHTAVKNALTRVLYTGMIDWDGELYKGQHEAIIDTETFDKTAKRIEEISWTRGDGQRKPRAFQAKHPLTGLLHCAHCTARYFAKGSYSGRGENRAYRPYYTCYSRAKTAKNMIIDPDCKNKIYPVVKLNEIIFDEVKKLTFDMSLLSTVQPITAKDNSVLDKRIEDIDGQVKRLLDLYQLGNDDIAGDLLERIGKLNKEKIALADELKVVEVPEITVAEAEGLLINASEILDHGELKQKRELLHSLIKKIIIDGDDIIIHWAFV